MKILFIIGLFCYFLLTGVYSYSQKLPSDNLPSEVINSFKKEFPKTIDVQWEKIKGNIYCAEFNDNKNHCAAYFDWLGILLQVEFILKNNEIPNGILTFIEQNYSSDKLLSARKTNRGEGLEYFVLMQKDNNSKFELLFDEKGYFIKELIEPFHLK